VSKYRIGIF